MTTEKMDAIVDDYRDGRLDRRAFLTRLITLTGSMAAAHAAGIERAGRHAGFTG